MDARLAATLEGDLADLGLERGDLVTDHGLQTAVLLSLFSDQLADDETLEDRRGFWGDNQFGSLLWLLEREKATAETAERARAYTERSLHWLIEEAIVESVIVTAGYVGRGLLNLTVSLERGAARGWSHIWNSFQDFEDSWEGGVLVVSSN